MNRSQVRQTLKGGLIVGGTFGGVALVQAVRAGAPMPGVLQPIALFAVLGFTIGALAGPLVAQAWSRRRTGGR